MSAAATRRLSQDALRGSPVYLQVEDEVGSEHADAVTVLLFAIDDRLTPSQRAGLGNLNATITDQVSHLRAQLTALSDLEAATTSSQC